MRPPNDLKAWARLLRSAGGDVPPVGSRLGAGLIDAALLNCVHKASLSGTQTAHGDAAAHDCVTDRILPTRIRPEERIWRWIDNDDPELESLLLLGDGPLLPPPMPIGGLAWRDVGEAGWARAGWPAERWTIETWTEAELSSLQATLHRACRPGGDRWHRRVGTARRWHLEHTQPDNATNRPWAIPVFLAAALISPTDAVDWAPGSVAEVAESRLYAETLLHNAMSQAFGAPNPLCAAILHDAANLLDQLAGPVLARCGPGWF